MFNSSLNETATARQMWVFWSIMMAANTTSLLDAITPAVSLIKTTFIYQNNSKIIVSLGFKIPFITAIEENTI